LPFDQGFSTTGEKLPDTIKIGRFTALNTDRYLYYAFYARAEELFRPYWEKYVRAAMFTYQAQHKTQGNEMWTSRLEILLDSQGRFVKGILRESSGLSSLDLAPVQAFQEAQRIPNPPPEMVKEDGLIHMDYEFTVEMSPQFASGG
jgi:TonB family protein